MRQAIETKYLGPTNTRGARIKATAQAGSVTVSYDDALGIDENHENACRALMAKYGWSGGVVGGGSASGRGNVYVLYVDARDGFHVVPK